MGTIRVPEKVPSPDEDCENLEEALAGRRANTKEIMKILGCRDASQRKKIRETYQHLHNKSLTDTLKSKLPHDYLVFKDFRNAVIMWMMDPSERDARLANKSLRKKEKGVDHLQVIIEIACASTPQHLMAVRQAYCSLFNCSLEEDIKSHVAFLPLRKFLLFLVSSYRYDRELVDANLAKSDSVVLHDAIEKEFYPDEVILMLSTKSIYQLKATFECYKQNYRNSILQDIERSGTGTFKSILKLVILCIDSPEKHFAEVVRNSIIGLGTDEDSLTRAIVTRAEVDLLKIREEYLKTYNSNLDKAVTGDTSGDYRDFLVTLLGGEIRTTQDISCVPCRYVL